MRPLVIGLTGGIGSGKSHVRSVLVSLGAAGIDADGVAHEIMAPGGPAFEPVVAAFGCEMVRPDGAIDRARLGARVFADPGARSLCSADARGARPDRKDGSCFGWQIAAAGQ